MSSIIKSLGIVRFYPQGFVIIGDGEIKLPFDGVCIAALIKNIIIGRP
jgi:hypothetical protein